MVIITGLLSFYMFTYNFIINEFRIIRINFTFYKFTLNYITSTLLINLTSLLKLFS